MLSSFRAAVVTARRDEQLYFAALLPEETIANALGEARELWQGWIYTPAVTVWVFLAQCLSPDHSCREAVAKLVAWRVARGQRACSAETGGFCIARQQLPETADLAQLYRRRWEAELNLRSLKVVLQMDQLRCKTPDRVRNELWLHLTAYNLLRKVVALAAEQAECEPRDLSFKGALQTLLNFLPLLSNAMSAATWCAELLTAIATHAVGDRPDRYEPRLVKRRPKQYKHLKEPRANYKRRAK